MTYLNSIIWCFIFLSFVFSPACRSDSQPSATNQPDSIIAPAAEKPDETVEIKSVEIKQLLESAKEQVNITRSYDPSYAVIPYPNGDVPVEKGVCTDVVIRAFRRAGVDLQKEVHEDMAANFAVYPAKWGLPSPDKNIDHRRVPNLQTFFTRRGKSLPITQNIADYEPGDVVAWDLDGKGMTHIGLVSDMRNEYTKRFFIIHNIGGGTVIDDKIFDWKIIGHYRYF